MLRARRYRIHVCFAELTLITLFAANGANAQAASHTSPSAKSPTAQGVVAPTPTNGVATDAKVTPTSVSSSAETPSPTGPLRTDEAGQTGSLASTSSDPRAPRQASSTPPSTDTSLGVATAPSALDAHGDPLRDEPLRKPPESARWLLFGAGLGTTAAWYAGAWGIRELWPSQADRSDLKIPVAGPFMDLAHTGCPASNPDCSTFQLVLRTVLVSLDAIGQVGGIALMLQGAVLSTASVEAPRSGPTANRGRSNASTSIVPVPWFDGNSGGGLGLVGRF